MNQFITTEGYYLTGRPDIRVGWSINKGYYAESLYHPELWVNQHTDPSIDNPQEAEYILDMLLENY